MSAGSPAVEPGRKCGDIGSSPGVDFPQRRASTEPTGGDRISDSHALRWGYL